MGLLNSRNLYLMPSPIWTFGHPIKMRTPTVPKKEEVGNWRHQGWKVIRSRWIDRRTISRTPQETRNIQEGQLSTEYVEAEHPWKILRILQGTWYRFERELGKKCRCRTYFRENEIRLARSRREIVYRIEYRGRS